MRMAKSQLCGFLLLALIGSPVWWALLGCAHCASHSMVAVADTHAPTPEADHACCAATAPTVSAWPHSAPQCMIGTPCYCANDRPAGPEVSLSPVRPVPSQPSKLAVTIISKPPSSSQADAWLCRNPFEAVPPAGALYLLHGVLLI